MYCVPVRFGSLPCLLFFLALSGCTHEADDEIKHFVDKTQSETTTNIEALPIEKPITRFVYGASDLRSPFEASKTDSIGKPTTLSDAGNTGPQPDFKRVRELLESFPLDSLKMAGLLEQGGSLWGLVVDSNGTIHRVAVGQYIGQNFGKIQKVMEEIIELQEWVPDGQGGWRERVASLRLPK